MRVIMYEWRRLSLEQRKELLTYRIQQHKPWHSPPTLVKQGQFHISAACYEHQSYIGLGPRRMDQFCTALIETLEKNTDDLIAWCVLPNHYHFLTGTNDLIRLKRSIGQLHGRISLEWNREENTLGRKVWHRSMDRLIRGDRHYWATINYIHHNPVHHHYVERWTDWPFSSANQFLTATGIEKAKKIWRDYPILEYGKNWDDPDL